MLETMLQNVRERAPLVHNITNYVTVNDCANILLACGASPIMADDPDDAEEITAVCAALNLNIGTLNARTIPAHGARGPARKRPGPPRSAGTPWARAPRACAPTPPRACWTS